MKKILTLIVILITKVMLIAQSPQSFSYQAVVRDATGNIVANSPVSLRISILTGSAQGQAIYTETHFTTTNQFGLVAINIGQGTTTYGQFDTIPWNIGSYFIQTELDAAGDANYQLMGTTQIMSVPYALYGRDEDFDTINELQDISFINDTLSINRGSSINIPLGYPGEIKTFAVSIEGSITIAELKEKGWAVCDGTSPLSQGIVDAVLTSTPDLRNKFICMSDNETSGTTGGNSLHNHQWLSHSSHTAGYITSSGGGSSSVGKSFNVSGNISGYPSLEGSRGQIDGDFYTTMGNNIPPYYELVYFIKVK